MKLFNVNNPVPDGKSCCQAPQAGFDLNKFPSVNTSLPGREEWILGYIQTPFGSVPRVATVLTRKDVIGEIRCRLSSFRDTYRIKPGLYAAGYPDLHSDVYVSANYKLSFDKLRRELRYISAWILVLDTNGINVWCAAGKGTFGTEELIRRMKKVNLDLIVNHRRIILPQLGSVGVRAGIVKQATGFRVIYGPVRAKDLPAFIRNGYKSEPGMRIVQFRFIDRLILTPMELIPVFRQYPKFALIILVIFGIGPAGIMYGSAFFWGMPFLVLGLISILTGALLMPVLLPWIPFRAFSLKGLIIGTVTTVFFIATGIVSIEERYLIAAACVLFPALSSFIALQFTGATTFTGVSGVRRELKISLPFYAAAIVVALVFIILFKINKWSYL